MSGWIAPDAAALEEVIGASEGRLILCSPYVKTRALTIVADALPTAVESIDIWTKLDHRDWLTGASDPEGLLDFVEQVESRPNGPACSLRSGENLHAKIIISDGPKALAGSANLTGGGYFRNVEAARVVDGGEVEDLRSLVDSIRPRLSLVGRDRFREFVSECLSKASTQEALIDLILEEIPARAAGEPALMSFSQFCDFLENAPGALAADLLAIARNEDGNNNSGKVKQAFFGVQRFLQEYPRCRAYVESLSDSEWFSVQDSPLWDDWLRFLDDFREDANADHRYDIQILRRYLTPSSGGTRTGGGGGDNELKRVWPFVARATRARP